ncbi:STAS domain-containing protein [Allonocardiopsis opalescens]|uniref:Anti-sigma factor antagonist n=1 Tax=Allonocardiopsis opalescens TaxID=1144618 RepID=A0A2T0Q9T3_9ACTN|nr:STAS domain-containing protein [Allonocardiopsis opalescens]PRY00561.1 anti-sigma B factor antagonist [Allonocardiopsis opalescens]
MDFSLATHRQPGSVVVSATGEVDATNAPRLAAALNAVLDDPGDCLGIIVDLAEVTFCDSRCIGVLVAAYRRARERRISLVAAAPQRPVYRLLVIAGIDQVLSIYDDVDSAVAALVPADT